MKSILFIHVTRIGDTLLATPAIRAVASAYPEATITVLAHPKRAEVLQHLSFIAKVGTITKGSARWRGHLPGRRHDLAFVFGYDEELVRYALRVANGVVAFRQREADLNRRLSEAVMPAPFQAEHSVMHYLRLPGAIGIPPAGLRLAYEATAEEVVGARRTLAAAGLANNASPLVGIQAASFPTKAYRDWPVEHFAELCDGISVRWPDARFLIFGGREEKKRTTWLNERLGDRAHLFAGRLSLRETAALMSLTDLYIGVDTGPTHLMSTFDIPMVALFHCLSSSAHTGPLGHPKAFVIDHPATGGDCSSTSSMGEIPVPAVLMRVEAALRDHPRRSRSASAYEQDNG